MRIQQGRTDEFVFLFLSLALSSFQSKAVQLEEEREFTNFHIFMADLCFTDITELNRVLNDALGKSLAGKERERE